VSALPCLDPCGRPCDWMRSAYETTMLFDASGVPQKVRWYRPDPAQPWAPDGNLFVSGNWIARDLVDGELGEQTGAKPWKNGADFRAYPIQTGDPCSIDPLLQAGFSPGGTLGPWTDGKLDCCTVAPFDCLTLPATLHVEITSLSGCSGLAQTFDVSTVAPCVWQGTATTWLGNALFTLGYSMGAWFRSLDCFTGDPTWTQTAFSWGPLNLEFYVTDTTACCSFAGTDTFHVRIFE